MKPKSRELRVRMWTGSSKAPAARPSSRSLTHTPRVRERSETQAREPETRRSRLGCNECKRRHVKCDETFPVCLRCQKRGSLCESTPRLLTWQMVSPATNPNIGSQCSMFGSFHGSSKAENKALLQYWLEKASQIMVIDPESNPLSFPILEHLDKSPSLKHALQSVGAAHWHFFDPEKLSKCYEERAAAMNLLIGELTSVDEILYPVFLSLLILGLSTPWTSTTTSDFGQYYLHGAHGLVITLLKKYESSDDRPSYFNFMLGAYLYWDMATAFLIPTMDPDHPPMNTNGVYSAVMDIAHQYHPMVGYSMGTLIVLGNIGRYCRSVVETGLRDEEVEQALEHDLKKSENLNQESRELEIAADAFRAHGRISLAAICYRRPSHASTDTDTNDNPLSSYLLNTEPMEACHWLAIVEPYYFSQDLENSIRQLALTTVRELTSVPADQPYINGQAIPLLTAASELTIEDVSERELTRQRFYELYSLNHLRGNLDASTLLTEIWARRDRGEVTSWLDVMVDMGSNIMLG